MNPFWEGVFVGLFSGGFIGFIAAALCVAAKDNFGPDDVDADDFVGHLLKSESEKMQRQKVQPEPDGLCRLCDYTPDNGPLDKGPLTDGDMEKVLRSIAEKGFPLTPARWQREFNWGYGKALEALLRADAERLWGGL